MIDDGINKKQRGRKPKLTKNDVQRSIYIDHDLWEAAGSLPVPRPDIVKEAFMNAVSYYTSDLPKLRWQLEELQNQKAEIEAKEAVISARIEELEAADELSAIIQQKARNSKEDAVKETMRLCHVFKKKMNHVQFSIISGMTGVDAAKIEVFLVDKHFRPSENEVRGFLIG